MKKITLLLMLAAALTWAACEKDPTADPTPNANDTTGGDEPAVVEKNVFSVADGKQVCLATGNLQYQASTNTWRIAPNAWDAMKDDNLQTSASYEGWIDNFRWASSGYEGYYPYATAVYSDASIDGTEYDWGVHNAIVNGENTDPAGTWRTMTALEWEYLINNRSAATVSGVDNARYALGTVANQKGLILFPDTFAMPEGVAAIAESSINNAAPYTSNNYSAEDWAKLQEAGCAFLPAAGCMSPSTNTMVAVDFLGCYWTATFIGMVDNMNRASQLWFNPNMVEIGDAGVAFPRSVRLVKDLK